MICEFAGADYVSKCYDLNDDEKVSWWTVKPELLKKNAIINLPYVIDTDGFIISQSLACMTFLGRKFGLMGGNEKETSKVEQVLCETHDLRNSAVGVFYGGSQENIEKFFKEVVPKSFAKFEAWLSAQKRGPYTVGEAPTAGDFYLWEMIDECELLASDLGEKSPLAEKPKLQKLYDSMLKEPMLQKYFTGALYHLQVNNHMAIWGNKQRSIGVLWYFHVRARAEPLRLLLSYAKIPYTNQFVTMEEWPKLKSEMPNGQLPAIKFPNGQYMGETGDLAKLIATRAGAPLMPADKDKQQAAARIFDISNTEPLTKSVFLVNFKKTAEEVEKMRPDVIADTMKVLEPLELELNMSGGAFFGGKEPHYGDFGLFHAINVFLSISKPSPKLSDAWKGWYGNMCSLPVVKKYLAERPQAGSGKVGFPGSLIATVDID